MAHIALALLILVHLPLGGMGQPPQGSADGAADAASAEAMLDAWMSVLAPPFDATRRDDEAYRQAYDEQRREAMRKRADLARQFFLAHPDHAMARQAAMSAWDIEMDLADSPAAFREDLRSFLSTHDLPRPLVALAHAKLVESLYTQDPRPIEELWQAALELHERFPGEGVAAFQLYLAADASPPEARVDRFRQVARLYPDESWGRLAAGRVRQVEGLGKPVAIDFIDELTGRRITTDSLRGKVVVIDFWATWCGPCIAEFPKLRELYARYADRGVEFIGVSLDGPGARDRLLQLVERHGLPWPQYYQGMAVESAFSESWGVRAIPQLFILDAEGNLRSTEARGRLEELIPQLLEERDQGTR